MRLRNVPHFFEWGGDPSRRNGKAELSSSMKKLVLILLASAGLLAAAPQAEAGYRYNNGYGYRGHRYGGYGYRTASYYRPYAYSYYRPYYRSYYRPYYRPARYYRSYYDSCYPPVHYYAARPRFSFFVGF
jgi:hypothetical protein